MLEPHRTLISIIWDYGVRIKRERERNTRINLNLAMFMDSLLLYGMYSTKLFEVTTSRNYVSVY